MMDSLSQFETLVEDYLAAFYRANPVLATQMGLHDYDYDLGDQSAEAKEAQTAQDRETLRRLEGLDPQAWPVTEQIDYQLLTTRLRLSLRQQEELRPWQRVPGDYASLATLGCYLLLLREFAPLRERLASLLERLRQVPQVLERGRANVTDPVRVFTEIALEELPGHRVIFDQVIPAAAAAEPDLAGPIQEAAQAASAALEAYGQHLQALLPTAAAEFAVGREYYDHLVREEHGLPYDADQLQELGEDWLAMTNERMVQTVRETAPGKGVDEVVEEIKRDHPAPEDLLATYEREMNRTRQFVLDHHLVDLPERESLEVIETPPPLRVLIPYAAYLPPAPFEDEQRGLFLVTPIPPEAEEETRRRLLAGHARAPMQVVTLHEGYPGHHLQLTTAHRLAPPRRNHLANNNLFIEGWAFYCEELMEQLGYLSDPRTKLMRLNAQRWRAARVILDTGLHTRGMRMEEAVRLLVEGAGLEEPAAWAEVKRYTLTPTQPTCYLVGKLEILKLRDEYERRHADYTLAQFHRDLLKWGSLPPALVARQWMAERDEGR